MICIGVPSWPVVVGRFIAPVCPSVASAARKEFQERSAAASLDEIVLLVWLTRVLPLSCGKEIDLPSSGRKRPCVPSAHAEQQDLGHVTEVESNASAVGAAVLSDLVPDDVGFVVESPCFHHFEPFGQHGIGAPKVKMGRRLGESFDG